MIQPYGVNPKFEYRNPKQIQMTENQNPKRYDLEGRTLAFARQIREFVKKLVCNTANIEDSKQLIRASGSVGANYIEANEALSKKDFLMRIKICRKEAKESKYWLNLIDVNDNSSLDNSRENLMKEAIESTNIFGAILRKVEEKP